ncbi:MAG: metallophosphoesterase [Clostridia bacterium]|nr:metallophosphoesterase [Clostridia bacterium]
MSLYVIGDLHLSLSVDKPMDEFGGEWRGYVQKLEQSWCETVACEDTVVVAGDISWGMDLAQAQRDFAFIEALPGRKVIIKGNHDYYWTTVSGMMRFFENNGFKTMSFLHNSFLECEGTAVCGTKGWAFDESEQGKLFNRELMRLEASLKAADAAGYAEKTVVMHYPPLNGERIAPKAVELFDRYGVKRCFYGHLHGRSRFNALTGQIGNTEYWLISADNLSFKPFKIV